MLTEPMLPPKKGYVEVVVDGVHTYRNVKTGELIDDEIQQPEPIQQLKEENKLLKAQVNALGGQYQFLEDCIAEMAAQVY